MMDPELYERVRRLIVQSEETPAGKEQVALLEEAVRLADEARNLDLQFESRLWLISSAFDSGEGNKLMAAITWCLGVFDEHPHRFDHQTILWQCKHAMSYFSSFPSVTLEQMAQAQEDIIKRYRQFGVSLRPIYTFACSNALAMGHHDQAPGFFETWQGLPIDGFGEGPEWETYFRAEYYTAMKQWDRAFQEAAPILSGRLPSVDVYRWLAQLLFRPLVMQGRLEEARDHHLIAYPRICRNPKFVGHAAEHLAFLAVTGNHAKALALFERHLPWSVESTIPLVWYEFYRHSAFLFHELAAAGRAEVDLKLPPAFPRYETAGRYATAPLAEWLEAEARRLAELFNRRNGNDYLTRLIEESLGMAAYRCNFPVPQGMPG